MPAAEHGSLHRRPEGHGSHQNGSHAGSDQPSHYSNAYHGTYYGTSDYGAAHHSTPTEPPTTVPPTVPPTEPPTTVPPTVPPTEPPATEPPAPNNDIGKEITQDGFTIKVLSVKQEGNQYTAVFALSYVGDISHSLSAKERIFVVNADRRSIPVEQVYDSEGNSLMGTSIENGQTLTITAVFTLTDGFTPAAFRYVYDIMGFRRLQDEL